MFRGLGFVGLIGVLAPACVTTRLNDSGAGGAGNYIIVERDAAADASTTTVAEGMTPLTPGLRNQLEGSACSGWTTEGENPPAILTFVVDVSSSMNDKTPSTGSRTKWEITRDSLQNAINHLPQVTEVGMLLYPNGSTISNPTGPMVETKHCVNTSALISVDSLGTTGSWQRQALTSGLQNAMVQGATPTEDAYDYALNDCLLPAMSSSTSDRSYMVLITDGEPTLSVGCVGTGEAGNPVDTHPIVSAIASAWATNGVRTFVIGSPGSEKSASTGADVRAWLSSAASAGQTPLTEDCSDTGTPNFCHVDLSQVPDFLARLQQALQSIAGQVLSCEYAIPSDTTQGGAVNPNAVNVIYAVNGDRSQELLIGQTDPNCTGGGGWYLDAASKIVLCANTCKTVQQDPNAILRILGGCQSITIVN